jgi:hypothetical protein
MEGASECDVSELMTTPGLATTCTPANGCSVPGRRTTTRIVPVAACGAAVCVAARLSAAIISRSFIFQPRLSARDDNAYARECSKRIRAYSRLALYGTATAFFSVAVLHASHGERRRGFYRTGRRCGRVVLLSDDNGRLSVPEVSSRFPDAEPVVQRAGRPVEPVALLRLGSLSQYSLQWRRDRGERVLSRLLQPSSHTFSGLGMRYRAALLDSLFSQGYPLEQIHPSL